MVSVKQKLKKIMRIESGRHKADKNLIAIIFLFLLFGLISLASVSAVIAYEKWGDAYYLFKHQLFGLTLGLIAFWFFARIDYHVWKRYALGFLIFSIVLLLLVFIPGLSEDYGKARSWINIFGYSFQPSEFVKLSFLIYLAAWLESRRRNLDDFHQGIGPFVIILGLISFLMILQPDIGTLSIIGVISLLVYFIGGGKLRHILLIIMAGSIAFVIMVQFKPYQMNRFKCFFDSSAHQQDICYQVNQSLIAVGSGGALGRGLGQSRQKYLYVPEATGDLIFAIIAEEMGLIISGLLVLGYFYIFYRGYLIARYARDDFGRLLAIGIASWITIQAIVNIGGTINLMPMTGVPLPFISYGGSALLASLSAAGILVNISKFTKTKF
ncbi:putative lipid II flippase FtsW [bacterium]|nr:putative lipid II flippase FtsW [bacterium]